MGPNAPVCAHMVRWESGDWPISHVYGVFVEWAQSTGFHRSQHNIIRPPIKASLIIESIVEEVVLAVKSLIINAVGPVAIVWNDGQAATDYAVSGTVTRIALGGGSVAVSGLTITLTGTGASTGTNYTAVTGTSGNWTVNATAGWSGTIGISDTNNWSISPTSRTITNIAAATGSQDFTAARYWYVATTGNDTTGTGQLAAPYLTPQKAHTYVQPGDTVYMRAGTYTGSGSTAVLKITKSGTATAKITFKNYTGEAVVFDANGYYYAIQQGINGSVADYTTTDGFECIGWTSRSVYCQYSDNMTVRNIKAHLDAFDGTANRWAIVGSYCDSLLVELCTCYSLTVGVRCTDCDLTIIRDCHIWNCWGATASIQNNAKGFALANRCTNGLVQDCVVHNCDDGGGDTNESSGHTLRGIISFCNGIRAGNTGGGKYGLKTKPDGVAVGGRDKIFDCVSFLNGGIGIVANDFSPMLGFDAWHNVAHGNVSSGFSAQYVAAHLSTAKNNIWSGNQASHDDDYNPTATGLNDYNLVQDGSYNPTYSPNNITAVPGFVNIAPLSVDTDGDGVPDAFEDLTNAAAFANTQAAIDFAQAQVLAIFGLAGGSPCINAGTISAGLSRSPYNSTAPDLGALET